MKVYALVYETNTEEYEYECVEHILCVMEVEDGEEVPAISSDRDVLVGIKFRQEKLYTDICYKIIEIEV